MAVKNLNHINIQTKDMAGTIAFYADILGLVARETPRKPAHERMWLYDGQGNALIHLNLYGTDSTMDRVVEPGAWTGAIHHVAFECDGLETMEAKLKSRGLDYGRKDIPELGLSQLFVTDPNHVLLELNFRHPV